MQKAIEQTSEILNSLSEGVITIDRDFKITFLNNAAEIFIGKKSNEVLGKQCKEVCKSDFCETECPISLVLKSGKNIYDFQSHIAANNGGKKPILLNAALLKNGAAEPAGGVISFRDDTKDNSLSGPVLKHEFYGIIGKSRIMTSIFELITEIKNSDASVLIQGETGTGKELITNAIQKSSQRSAAPFVKVNCAVLPPTLLASELFGHVKGAFTDARQDRIGRFESADHGTIFLDEIAEMPIPMQTQLLRILQDGTFERLGESKTRKVDVRIIAATNIDINSAIKNKTFRSDLYFRLNVIPITAPALRNRKDDIPYLLDYFIHKYNYIYKKNIQDIDSDALDAILNHDWPGNIRELENIVEFAFIRSKKNNSICICGLPQFLRNDFDCPTQESKINLSDLKADSFIRLLEKNGWNQSKVAEILGVNRTTIWRRAKALGIKNN